MFGFLRAVADNSESEVDQYSNDLQNTVNTLLDQGSRAEARARKGYIGNRVSRRLNNSRALSTMDYSDDDESTSSSLGLIDYDWSSNFHELGEDADFWLSQFLPDAPRKPIKPKVSRKEGGHIQLQIHSRQRIFERMARRARNSRRVGHSSSSSSSTDNNNNNTCTRDARNAHPHTVVMKTQDTEEKVASVLSSAKKSKKHSKSVSKVQFPSDLGEDSDTKVTKWIDDDVQFSDDGDDDDTEDDAAGFDSDNDNDNDEKESHMEEQEEDDDNDDMETSNTPDYACKYCRYNPYTSYIREVGVLEDDLTQSQLPYIYGSTAKQLIADLPSRTMAKLHKIYTTTFAKDIEQVILGLKKGVCLSVKLHDSIAEAGPREYNKNINTSAKVCNSFFKICVDTVFGQNTCTPKGLQARNDNLVDKANVYVPTKYGVVLAVKDEYALSNILAIAQYHYVSIKLLPRAAEDFDVNKHVLTNMGDTVEYSEHTLVSTVSSAIQHGYTYLIYLSANIGFCTCCERYIGGSLVDVTSIDSLNEAHPFSDTHAKALGITDVTKLNPKQYTFVPPHAFTIKDLFTPPEYQQDSS